MWLAQEALAVSRKTSQQLCYVKSVWGGKGVVRRRLVLGVQGIEEQLIEA
jgi:hypothetical protein